MENNDKNIQVKDMGEKDLTLLEKPDIINNVNAVTEIIEIANKNNVEEIECIPEKTTSVKNYIGVSVKEVTVGLRTEVEVIRKQSLYIKYRTPPEK